jgi:aminoglycoside-2''-adenylyltransferase
MLRSQQDQLSAIARTHELFTRGDIDYWLFGGWGIDFHLGSITRPHPDVDVAVWLEDQERIASLLESEAWKHAPEADEDGGTGYERNGVRLELTFVARGDRGEVYIPMLQVGCSGRTSPCVQTLQKLSGVRARVLDLAPLKRGKSNSRDDRRAAKDRADFAALSRLG